MSARTDFRFDGDDYDVDDDYRGSSAQVGYQATRPRRSEYRPPSVNPITAPTDDVINLHGSMARAGRWVDRHPVQTLIGVLSVAVITFLIIRLIRRQTAY